jgi:chemotaxis regulatin CheY-phosphate phosphatase CheZ
MRARAGDHGTALGRCIPQRRTQAAGILDRLCDRAGYVCRHLDDRLQQLGLDPALVRSRFGHLVEARDELVALLVEQLELLLDAQAEGRALAEVDLDG